MVRLGKEQLQVGLHGTCVGATSTMFLIRSALTLKDACWSFPSTSFIISVSDPWGLKSKFLGTT